jgi:hypothetical protein
MSVMTPPSAPAMLIDRVQPRFDATILRHAVAEAPPARAYAAALGTDLLALSHDDRVFRALFGLRGLPDRVLTLLGPDPARAPAPVDGDLRARVRPPARPAV